MSRNLVTQEGYNNFFQLLSELKTTERRKVSSEIEVAREHGDISENAEYTYAKEKQALLEAKIAKMEEFLSNSEVITKNMISKDGRIVFGSWVRLLNQDTDEERKYQIVGEVESNVSEGRLNYKTPFAREILGKRAGDEIEFVTPKGDEQYWEVLDVRYD
mgnify:CR=1 FL=1|jgi:transcription elongation factor GreA|tara:strand:- start:241 stop:720 length:480 start_codon:yes stop_codon:yes gene_type:complete